MLSNEIDVINDVKLFPIVYRRIYCRKRLTLSNQALRYNSKCYIDSAPFTVLQPTDNGKGVRALRGFLALL